jgi:CheY-like chemotaxis protein
MKEQTRRNLLRYGIAIDLVILATGAGMLVPATAPLLIVVYAVAVALSMWKGGWQGSAVALVLSFTAFVFAFPTVATAPHLATLAVSAIAAAALVRWAAQPASSGAPAEAQRATGPVAVPAAPAAEEEPALQDFAQRALERTPLAEVVSLHDSRAEAERVRLQETERVRLQEELEARVAQEREAVQRELEERLAEERRALEAERDRVEAERQLAEDNRQLAEAERERAEAERIRLENELRERREHEERVEAARVAAEEEAGQRRAEAERLEAARIAAEEEAVRQRTEAERRAAEIEAERQRLEADRLRIDAELQERLAQEREATQRELQERLEAERHAAEEDLRRQLEVEREFMRAGVEQELAAEREQIAAERQSVTAERQSITAERDSVSAERERLWQVAEERVAAERERFAQEAEERLAAERARIEREAEERIAAARPAEVPAAAQPAAQTAPAPAAKPAPPPAKPSLVDTLTGWFRREERPRAVNLKNKRLPVNTMPARRSQPVPSPRPSSATMPAASGKPRLLLIERRRATADTMAPKLKYRGVEMEVVERWVDAVDEIFRFKPHALFLDIEHPEFDRMHRTVTEKTTQLPIVLTGRAGSTPPSVRRAAFIGRPYDDEEVARLAHLAKEHPEDLLAEQSIPRAMARVAPAATMVAPPSLRAPVVPKPSASHAAAVSVYQISPSSKPITNDEYEITCFTCRAPFNAIDADWCSCLAKERTLVCTNCLACFCKAPPAYKEKFWVAAPPRLFERKTSEARKQGASLPPNALRADVKRPLVLTVEDDEEIQAIVQRVCANLEYGFIWATNGQDGLELAREYRPNMILSDAFMPKLDGREMCRMLKEDPAFAETRMVVMTGLYTDTKYRSEAVKRFHVDDYVAKPVAITDLINLLQKHLEGMTGLPMQEDLHELHRQNVDLREQLDQADGAIAGEESQAPDADAFAGLPADGITLSDVLLNPADLVPIARTRSDAYEVCCFNCQATFDATHAEWCSCVGRDNTLVCRHCGGCFCKAPAAYRERFWIDAPPSLFERKMIGSKRNLGARSNPAPTDVKRPLILLVEDDENVQLIVRTVVSNMGYGFVVGADGQEGLSLAREYGPDMILSDAFMPKLDGREMCRLLKEDPNTARSKAVIMTGLYTDRKYRNEALDYFKVDDYVAKPLAVDDLIKLFKKHLPQEVTTAH